MTTIRIARSDDHLVQVDESKFSDDVKAFIFSYGVRQLLNDAGSAEKTPDGKLAMANKKLDALYEGKVRSTGGGVRVSADPVQAEAEKLAWDVLKVKIRAAGHKVTDIADDKKTALIAAYLAKNPELVETARARVEGLRAVKSDDIDLGDLGL